MQLVPKANKSLDQSLQAPYPSDEDDLLTPQFRNLITDTGEFV
jgi:hypothetical protein